VPGRAPELHPGEEHPRALRARLSDRVTESLLGVIPGSAGDPSTSSLVHRATTAWTGPRPRRGRRAGSDAPKARTTDGENGQTLTVPRGARGNSRPTDNNARHTPCARRWRRKHCTGRELPARPHRRYAAPP